MKNKIRLEFITEDLVSVVEEMGYRVEYCGHTQTLYVYDKKNITMIYQKFGFSPCMGCNFIDNIDELHIIAYIVKKAWNIILC